MNRITAQVILRPHYDNTQLGDFVPWVHDNALTLCQFAIQLGFDVSSPDDELARWVHCQHDIEVLTSTAPSTRRGDSADGSKTAVETVRAFSTKLPHGDSL